MKFYIILGASTAVLVFAIGGIKTLMDSKYEQGYADGADSLSAKHVDQVCVQWLFQSDLEAARRRVCAK